MLDTAGEIVGPIAGATVLAVSRRQRIEDVEAMMRATIERLDHGDGVLILADMLGGTAANVALQLVSDHRIEVVTGFNLPMLLKASAIMEGASDLVGLAEVLQSYGQRNVIVASGLLREQAT